MVKKINIEKLNYKINLEEKETRLILSIVIILLIILLFRKKLASLVEKIILFVIIFLLILVISKNLVISFIGAAIIFLLFNLLIGYRNTFENFQDMEKEVENKVKNETNTTDDETLQKSKNNIKDLLKKVNGGIKLNEEDLKETDKLNINLEKYKDDNAPNALKIAQKETYELINTVNALKDTITTLAPVLTEGKKIMSMFENIKI